MNIQKINISVADPYMPASWQSKEIDAAVKGEFAIHRLTFPDPMKWGLTHVRSGFLVTKARTKRQAIAAMASANNLPLGWETLTFKNSKRRAKPYAKEISELIRAATTGPIRV